MPLSVSTNGMSFTNKVSLSWTTLNGTMGARARMEPPEEELKIEPPPKEEDKEDKEDKEDLFILKAEKMIEE